MIPPAPALMQAMQRISALLQAGNFPLARSMLEQVVRDAPRLVEAHRLLGGALQALGDDAGAERALRAALAIDPQWAPALTSLGELLMKHDRPGDAESLLRSAVASARPYPRSTIALVRLLNETSRYEEALALTTPLAAAKQVDPDLLTQHANALAALNRHDEEIACRRRIAAAAKDPVKAELDLATALDAAGRHRDAEATARSAIGRGAATAKAHFVHACTLLALNRFDETQAALLRALALEPTHADAHSNLAQLIWMRSGDVAAAQEHLDATLRTHPDAEALLLIKAALHDGAGDPRGAQALLAERATRDDASADLLMSVAQSTLKFDPVLARAYTQRAVARASAHARPLAQRLHTDSLVASGALDEAQLLIDELLAATPDNAQLIAAQTTVWRLRDDPRYVEFCDYAQMARGWTIDTPTGWSTLADYLRDLAASLHALHGLHTHPLYQSLRHGSQTAQNLEASDDPAIRAFFKAIDAPIREHIATIDFDPTGKHPLRRRKRNGYRLNGAWSVRLRGQGYHTNHVHPAGWLSSACYIELPRAVVETADDQKAGWLKFGEPGIRTQPPLTPEYYIRPQPGLLALFPSYFWHGTVPFEGDDTRLTIAFDVVPA